MTTAGSAGSPTRVIRPRWLVAAGVAQALWLAWFLVTPLPSTGEVRIRRVHLLLEVDTYARQALDHLGHLGNLPQRLPIGAASLLVGAACAAVGSRILRGLRLRLDLAPVERLAIAFGLGAAVVGMVTMILGRTLGLAPGVVRPALGATVAAGLAVSGVERWRARHEPRSGPAPPRWSTRQVVGFAAVAGPFLVLAGLGAMLPTIEFDALEYHLQGPKEFFLDGRIGFLPHNVYTSMPSGVEMLTTLTMEVLDDWWLGALAGQELIAWFAPASAVLIAAAATRLAGSTRAGWFAGVVYLSTPWVFRAGNTPFVEGPLCFMHAALIWAVIRCDGFGREGPAPGRTAAAGALVGLLAGGAFAIKYPSLVTAVVPAAVVVVGAAIRTRSPGLVTGFLIGLGLVAGPWLVRNRIDTGNPVYPLAYSVFGGEHWSLAREARWQTAHGPRPVAVGLLVGSLVDVAGRSDWQSPLYLALAPLSWFAARGRRASLGLLLYAAYLFGAWWLLTHRLDRFWLPMLPALAILAGLGADAVAARSRLGSAWLGLILALGVGFNLVLCTTELAGPTNWTGDLATVRAETARTGTPSLARLDELLPPGARPLVIGQAGTFGLRHRPTYNTVFDRENLEWFARSKPANMIESALKRRGITHIYVDWAEIDRYRQPGNYGYDPFVTPEVVDGLVRARAIGPPTRVGDRQFLYPVR